MADTAVQYHFSSEPQWQNIGSTSAENHPNTTHLRPLPGQPDLSEANTHSLYRTHSVAKLRRAHSGRKSASDKVNYFVNRLSWNSRAKNYLFGQQFLQRQPSFVVTPDRSSFAYTFKDRDLVKRKPQPRAQRTSQPIAVWKNQNPMEVLKNQGVVEIPQFLVNREAPLAPRHATKPSTSTKLGELVDTATPKPNTQVQSHPVPRDSQNWGKISLPVKHNRNSSSSGNDAPTTAAYPGDTPNNNSSTTTPQTGSTNRSQRSSWLDAIPQTPIDTSRNRSRMPGRSNSLSSHTNTNAPSNTSGPPHQARPRPRSMAAASAITATPPHSPTSLPSSYRPESWRRSAILNRNSLDAAFTGAAGMSSTESVDDQFVSVWNQYLRKAVAERVVAGKERRSWEMHNEMRWSQNMGWDSETSLDFTESSSGSSHAESDNDHTDSDHTNSDHTDSDHTNSDHTDSDHSNSDHVVSDSNRKDTESDNDNGHDLGAGERTNNPADQSRGQSDNPADQSRNHLDAPASPSTHTPPSEHTPPSAPRAVTSSNSLSQLQSSSPKRQSMSRLAPLNSPREMASASRIALQTQAPQSSPSPQSTPASVKSQLSTSRVPLRHSSLFAVNSSWQPEHEHESEHSSNHSHKPTSSSSSASSTSHINAEDYIFPSLDRSVLSDADINNTSPSTSSGRSEHSRILGQHRAFQPSMPEIEFDFRDRRPRPQSMLPTLGSPLVHPLSMHPHTPPHTLPVPPPTRKRPLSMSPIRTPPQSPPHEAVLPKHDIADLFSLDTPNQTQREQQLRSSTTSLESTPNSINLEDAPAIVRSQSLWKKRHPDPKRVRSSTSRELLVHTRQKTMESMWGGEDDESEGSNN